VANDADAAAAIKDAVEARTSKGINDLINTPARDSRGRCVPSYGEIRRRAPWSRRPPDVSLDEGEFVYDPNFQKCRAP
jgi:hypothetical protein